MSNPLDMRCPSCQSKQLTTTEKNSGRLTLTCLACGKIFKATDSDVTPQKITDKPPARNITPATGEQQTAAPDLNAINQRIVEIVQSSGKLYAIKYCHDQTGWSLNRCKTHVDQLAAEVPVEDAGETVQNNAGDAVALDPFAEKIIEIARTRGKLQAVKHYRDRTGKSLKESLDYVDRVVPRGAFKKTEGCFIATTCYGNYEAPEVMILRQYRDQVLKKSLPGKVFIHVYYRTSPTLAQYIKKTSWLKQSIRRYLLDPLVRHLQEN